MKNWEILIASGKPSEMKALMLACFLAFASLRMRSEPEIQCVGFVNQIREIALPVISTGFGIQATQKMFDES